MPNKTLLYIHGLSSSGNSGTAVNLQRLLPNFKVIAPDLPINPHSALKLLFGICEQSNPNIVIGTSMGGMFAQQMRGFSKIVINPAFHVSEFMRLNLGQQQFLNKREDSIQEYQITSELCDDYLLIEKSQFKGINEWEITHTYGLFGANDLLINCQEEYLRYYKHSIIFNGEHRLTYKNMEEVIVPLINEIV